MLINLVESIKKKTRYDFTQSMDKGFIMTIVLEIEEGQPFYTQHTISGAEHWVIAPIGCDPETGFNYVVHVALTLVAGYGPETRELIFMLVESDPADPHVEERWYLAGNETKSILPNQYDRRKTRALVFSCIEVLIREVQPETVFMTPTGSNYPPRRSTSMLRFAGYSRSEAISPGKVMCSADAVSGSCKNVRVIFFASKHSHREKN